MKKRKILILLVLMIIVLPITVLASNYVIKTKLTLQANAIASSDYSKLNNSIDEYENNRKNKQEMQEKYIKENNNEVYSKEANKDVQAIKQELDETLSKKEEENKKEIQYVINIVKRYYPNQVIKILENAQIEEENMSKSGKYLPISNAECELISLMINIIQEGKATKEETDALKTYIRSQEFKVKEIGNSNLLEKMKKIND